MKRNRKLKPILVVILTTLSSFNPTNVTEFEGWDGTVSFSQLDSGPWITKGEWKIDGNFMNSKGPIVHSTNFKSEETTRSCTSTKEGNVEISMDVVKGTYSIVVSGAGDCTGNQLENGVTTPFTIPGGDSTIFISDQPIGTNPNKLTGTITVKTGPSGQGRAQTLTYKWNLTKSE